MKGWRDSHPYSHEDILRNPMCLMWARPNGKLGHIPSLPTDQNWSPPPFGSLKWNVDASVNRVQSASAIGGVLRNCSSKFMCMFSSPIPAIEINCAEILAIFRAVQISIKCERFKNHPLVIESDSSNAVRWCNDDSGGPWNMNFQLNFIRNARKGGLNLEIIHRSRATNIVADSLAKQGLVRDAEFIAWL